MKMVAIWHVALQIAIDSEKYILETPLTGTTYTWNTINWN